MQLPRLPDIALTVHIAVQSRRSLCTITVQVDNILNNVVYQWRFQSAVGILIVTKVQMTFTNNTSMILVEGHTCTFCEQATNRTSEYYLTNRPSCRGVCDPHFSRCTVSVIARASKTMFKSQL